MRRLLVAPVQRVLVELRDQRLRRREPGLAVVVLRRAGTGLLQHRARRVGLRRGRRSGLLRGGRGVHRRRVRPRPRAPVRRRGTVLLRRHALRPVAALPERLPRRVAVRRVRIAQRALLRCGHSLRTRSRVRLGRLRALRRRRTTLLRRGMSQRARLHRRSVLLLRRRGSALLPRRRLRPRDLLRALDGGDVVPSLRRRRRALLPRERLRRGPSVPRQRAVQPSGRGLRRSRQPLLRRRRVRTRDALCPAARGDRRGSAP